MTNRPSRLIFILFYFSGFVWLQKYWELVEEKQRGGITCNHLLKDYCFSHRAVFPSSPLHVYADR